FGQIAAGLARQAGQRNDLPFVDRGDEAAVSQRGGRGGGVRRAGFVGRRLAAPAAAGGRGGRGGRNRGHVRDDRRRTGRSLLQMGTRLSISTPTFDCAISRSAVTVGLSLDSIFGVWPCASIR